MHDVSVADILELHDLIIHETGGLIGVRDKGLLESAINKPQTHVFGIERYKDTFSKAASLLESIALYHPFNDGNKRTAMATADLFLFLNNISIDMTNTEYEEFMLEVVSKKPSIKKIATWLKQHQVEPT